MRVGVLVGNLDIAAGGSYTYSIQILDYLETNTLEGVDFIFICSRHQSQSLRMKFPGLVYSFKVPSKFRIVRYIDYLISGFKLLMKRKEFSLDHVRYFHLSSLMEDLSPDIVWSIEPLSHPLECPYITTVWDLEHRKQPYFPEVSLNGEWERREKGNVRVLGRASFIVTGTEIGKKEIEKFYGINPERIIVAPFPLKPALNNPKLNRDPNLIFYPAQFWPHKNHANLLFGFQLALKKERSLKLILVGSNKGNESKIRNQITNLDLSKHVEIWGTVPNEVLKNLYETASLMIYPSFFGPDNLPPLEAIAHRCPLAVANQAGTQEQLLGGVPTFDPTSPAEICEIILKRSDLEIGSEYLREMHMNRNSDLFFEKMYSSFQHFSRIAVNFKG